MRSPRARTAFVLAAATVLAPVPALAQEPPASVGPISGTRIVEVRLEPETPSFGEVFRLHVTARLPRRSGVSVMDTLGPTNALRSAGRGRWEEAEAPGDSVEIRATFPVIAFRDGTRSLPGLLIGTGGARTAPGMPDVPERISLGAVEVGPMTGFGPEGGGSVPRPPADVVGADWSFWALMAGGALLLGLVGIGVVVLREGEAESGDVVAARLGDTGGSPTRDDALRRLDEIRAAGWHRNGRVHDFYRASTDTLRRFVEGMEGTWDESLTSTELLARAAERWGASRIEALRPAVELAERVKFGGVRPTAEDAEGDWKAIRSWIEETP